MFYNLHPMDWETIKMALNITWQGLLAIFVVIALIIIAVKLTIFFINKIGKMKAAVEKEVEESDQY